MEPLTGSPDVPPVNYIGTRHCGLCRQPFQRTQPAPPDIWRSTYRAVLKVKETRVAVLTDTVPHPNRFNEFTFTQCEGEQRSVKIVPKYEKHCRVDERAFCLHEWCYENLKWKVPGITPDMLFKLAQSLTPDVSSWCIPLQGLADHDFDTVGTLNALAKCSGQLDPHKLLPSFLSRLPWELQHQIWEYVGISTPLSTSSLVISEVSRLVAEIDSKPANIVCLERGNYLAIFPLSIFGTKYIRSVLNCREGEGMRIEEHVEEIRTAATAGGICAVKLIGKSWDSGWLGIIPRTKDVWYGRILWERPGEGEAHALWIRCDYNALACINISVEIPSPRKVTRDAWDQPDFPLIQHVKRRLFEFDQDLNETPSAIRYAIEVDPWCFFRYLPFYKGRKYITGLTVYVLVGRILGIEAHYPVGSRLIGRRGGCSRYCPFEANERITHIWIEGHLDVDWTVTLTLQTTKKRIVDLGPYISSRPVPNERRWVLLGGQGVISGLFYRNLSTLSDIYNIGITIEEPTTTEEFTATKSCLTPRYHMSNNFFNVFQNFNTHFSFDIYFSMASLRNLCKVEMCRDDSRCIGMLIHYKDGSRNVLGQWKAHDVSSHSCIYTGQSSEIDRIQFKIAPVHELHMVTDIEFLEVGQKKNLEACYLSFSFDEPLAWWYSSEDRSDLVGVWAGEMADAPEDCIHLQQSTMDIAV